MQKNRPDKTPGYIETLLTTYFKDMQQKIALWHTSSSNFEQDLVYDKVHHAIQLYNKRKRMRWFAAAAIIVFLTVSTLFYSRWSAISNLVTPVAMLEKQSATGQITLFTLTDGTKIWLNSGSKLSYPEKFNGEQREVSLSGEAYFEVAHTDKPFIIHTGDIKTQVLGTSFNISAYQDEKNIRITVLTGKVGVGTKTGTKTMYLTPNQQAVFDKEQHILTRYDDVAASSEVIWRNDKLVYKSVKLGKVISDIQHRYDIHIKADKRILNCTISVDLGNKPAGEVMQILAEIINGTSVLKNEQYILTGIGCQ
ncbi:DUF4974 domain-containing protein (plasmid) [Pedobacter sp. BS3]|uniref:FecR family protein n=1 Tax=Pedobacter sp. BS3 TaxID=2567937 RepID=UPI0011EEAF4E|nr:FecR domain-containing protein [Pedobacter sp. BS3]TZF86021.1 DUF4974 domain-containing protein [Pedobacter sp. BS3]